MPDPSPSVPLTPERQQQICKAADLLDAFLAGSRADTET